MRLTLILLLLCLPHCLFAQSQSLKEADNVYNVYRRTAEVITGYNKEFASSLKRVSNVVQSNDSVTATVSLPYDKNSCLEHVVITIDVLIEAKENRTKLTMHNIRFTQDGADCAKSGFLYELPDCNKCGISISLVKDFFRDYKEAFFTKYHNFLKTKSKDSNW